MDSAAGAEIMSARCLALAGAVLLAFLSASATGGDELDPLGFVKQLGEADRAEREAVEAGLSAMNRIEALEACLELHKAIGSFKIESGGSDARERLDRMFKLSFAVIDAALGEQARKSARIAYELAKSKAGGSPWAYSAGFRLIHATACKP